MDPAGKAALINGGARLGETIATALARRGCSVAMTWRTSREAADQAARAARAAGVAAEAIRADATDETQVEKAVAEAARRLGRLDILINMASTYVRTPIDKLTVAAWQEGLDSNARSALLFSVKAAPYMKSAGAGRIVNFADWLPVSGRPRYRGYTSYYVAKAAVAALTESLALELAPEILVNAVAPGPTLPPKEMTPEEHAAVIEATPLKRWGGAEEMAKVVLFLIESDFVTGECIRADGGRHLF